MLVHKDPLRFVLSLNLHRRHLTEAQKVILALDLLPHMEAAANRQKASLRQGASVPARLSEQESVWRGDA